jgi:hypothetical protein
MPPISKSLEIYGQPRHAKGGVIVARKEGNYRLMWDNNDLNPVHSKTIENKAAHLRIFLNVMAGQNAELVSCVLRNLLKQLGFELLPASQLVAWRCHEASVFVCA